MTAVDLYNSGLELAPKLKEFLKGFPPHEVTSALLIALTQDVTMVSDKTGKPDVVSEAILHELISDFRKIREVMIKRAG